MTPEKPRGNHTWTIEHYYHRCPECGYILESRDNYRYQLGKFIKDLECPRCSHAFTEIKERDRIGPIFG